MLVFVRFRFSPSLYTASFLLYASSKAATAMVKIVVVRHICVVSFFSMNYERKRHCIVLILCTILAHDQVLGLGGYIQSTVPKLALENKINLDPQLCGTYILLP